MKLGHSYRVGSFGGEYLTKVENEYRRRSVILACHKLEKGTYALRTCGPGNTGLACLTAHFSFLRRSLTIAAHMKMQLKIAIFAGVGLGIAALHGLHAGQTKALPAFVISNIEVTDPAKYQKYAEESAAVVASYHGKILARGGKTVVFDGRAPRRVILIEFASMADAQHWRSSSEFQKLKSLQQQSSTYIESFAIEGVQ